MRPIEAKVVVPAAVSTTIVGFTGSVLAMLTAFGVDLSQDEITAVVGLVASTLPMVALGVGYLTPHTPRPDLQTESAGQHARPSTPLVASGMTHRPGDTL